MTRRIRHAIRRSLPTYRRLPPRRCRCSWGLVPQIPCTGFPGARRSECGPDCGAVECTIDDGSGGNGSLGPVEHTCRSPGPAKRAPVAAIAIAAPISFMLRSRPVGAPRQDLRDGAWSRSGPKHACDRQTHSTYGQVSRLYTARLPLGHRACRTPVR